jgi:translocation and assembly module TamA
MFRLLRCVSASRASLACALLWLAAPAIAQSPREQPLDPGSPMAELPEIGIDWPDMGDLGKPEPGTTESAKAREAGDEHRYQVTLEGIDRIKSAPIQQRFDELSALRREEGKSANIAQIDRRTREDQQLLANIMRTSGYYDAQIETKVEQAATGPLTVRFSITPGPLYRLQSVAVEGLAATGVKAPQFEAILGLSEDDAVDADDIVGGRAALEKSLREQGFPFAKVGEPDVVIDHQQRNGTLVMSVDAGGAQKFGLIRIKSEKPPFSAEHVSRIARFNQGEAYDQKWVEDLRRALVATGVVGAVDIAPVKGSAEGSTDIEVALEPAPLRTIAGDAGYGTGEGIRVEASWTHRNLIRPEGALTIRGVAGTREQLAGVIFRQSNFRVRDRILNARILGRRINQPAFDARTLEIGTSIERQSNIIWQKRWTWNIGAEFIASDESDITAGILARRQTYLIGALPISLGYDRSNDLLDPTKGFRLGLRLSPEISLRNGRNAYLRAQIDGSIYQAVSPRVVLAGRVRLGSVFGAVTPELAPSRRFYAGGGGSVRGFGYQAIGPRDAFNDPVGGRSLAEFSLEARIRFGAFGVVPFIDAGNIYDGRLPRLSGFRYGAGLGVRYHSSFGPIRVDVGTPINPQTGDNRITVFVSLGQAF